MDRRRVSLFFLSLFVAGGCASPPPARDGPELSVVGASLKTKQLIGSIRETYAFFVRVDDEGSPLHSELIPSNYERGGYVFLFNARPGRYALVSAGHVEEATGSSSTPLGGGVSAGLELAVNLGINVYLSKELIDKTAVSVGSGEWVFMGDIALERKDWNEADEVQRHYHEEALARVRQSGNWIARVTRGGRHDPAVERELDQSQESLERFLKTSRKFAGGEWASTLRSPVAAGSPER